MRIIFGTAIKELRIMNEYTDFSVVYDALTQNVCYDRRAKYFYHLLKRYGACSQGVLLDLACGTGSMTLEMAKLGWKVIGCDHSSDMLAKAFQKQQATSCSIQWVCQSMQRFHMPFPVDAIICTLDSLNHMVDPHMLFSTFQRVSLFLKRGGVFIFDVNTPFKHEYILANHTFVYDQNDVFLVWRNALKEKYIVNMELDFFIKRSNQYMRKREMIVERAYKGSELFHMLVKAHLAVKAVYAADTYHVPSPTTQRWVYVVKKEK